MQSDDLVKLLDPGTDRARFGTADADVEGKAITRGGRRLPLVRRRLGARGPDSALSCLRARRRGAHWVHVRVRIDRQSGPGFRSRLRRSPKWRRPQSRSP